MTQDVIVVAGLVVLFIGVARALWVRWLADDAPGWDITLREQYTIGGWIEYLLALAAFALIIIGSIS
jgi:hypothetical protein